MDSQSPKTPQETLILLLERGMYSKFLETASFLKEEIIAESICSFVRNIDSKLGKLGITKAISILQEVKSQVIEELSNPYIKEEFNKASRNLRYIERSIRKLELVSKLNGTEVIEHDQLLNELERIAAGPASEARAKTHALCERIAIHSLPAGVGAVMTGLYTRFTQDALKRAIKALHFSWK